MSVRVPRYCTIRVCVCACLLAWQGIIPLWLCVQCAFMGAAPVHVPLCSNWTSHSCNAALMNAAPPCAVLPLVLMRLTLCMIHSLLALLNDSLIAVPSGVVSHRMPMVLPESVSVWQLLCSLVVTGAVHVCVCVCVCVCLWVRACVCVCVG